MSVRAIVVFFASLLIIRLGNQRVFGNHSIFDIALGIIYGSVMSRAITGNAPFWPTLIAALVLVLLHRGLATLAYHSSGTISNLIKGQPIMLIKDGEMQKKALQKYSITENDLLEAMRIKGGVTDVKSVETACLERSGAISIVPKNTQNT
ncbi:DUF421 domain-containing protein [Pontibacter sp. KCTC 32443]|nr:DUF421 domain-containing protein [Pontibacter sp. KCTC 32443]